MNLPYLNKNPQSGFTLLEVIIAMAVLVFISFSIYQATIETYRLRDTLSAEGDFYNALNLSTSIIQRDIANIYTPTVDPTIPGSILLDDQVLSTNYWLPAKDPGGTRPSRFVGTDNKLSFISLSHVRIYKDSPESEFAKVAYDLKPDTQTGAIPGTQILVKTESPNAFAQDATKDPTSHSYDLLRGVKKLTYTYYQRDGNTWKTYHSWDNEKEDVKNKYPSMVEMDIELVGQKNESFSGKFKFRLEIPFYALGSTI